MKILLQPGDVLEIELGDTDGNFLFSYDHNKDGLLQIIADTPDTRGREGVIYCEDFNAVVGEEGEMKTLVKLEEPNLETEYTFVTEELYKLFDRILKPEVYVGYHGGCLLLHRALQQSKVVDMKKLDNSPEEWNKLEELVGEAVDWSSAKTVSVDLTRLVEQREALTAKALEIVKPFVIA